MRLVVKKSWQQTSIEDAAKLATSRWHEVRQCGLQILVAHFEQSYNKQDHNTMRRIVGLYLTLHPHINNWDLVDMSVYKIVGRYELLTHDYSAMDEWIRPNHSLWQQRMSMVATWIHARQGFYEKLTERAETLLPARHDLLHKATGWMLREMYKHDENGRKALLSFLEKHVMEMPATMLSYAMEKMGKDERAYWRSRRRQ